MDVVRWTCWGYSTVRRLHLCLWLWRGLHVFGCHHFHQLHTCIHYASGKWLGSCEALDPLPNLLCLQWWWLEGCNVCCWFCVSSALLHCYTCWCSSLVLRRTLKPRSSISWPLHDILGRPASHTSFASWWIRWQGFVEQHSSGLGVHGMHLPGCRCLSWQNTGPGREQHTCFLSYLFTPRWLRALISYRTSSWWGWYTFCSLALLSPGCLQLVSQNKSTAISGQVYSFQYSPQRLKAWGLWR